MCELLVSGSGRSIPGRRSPGTLFNIHRSRNNVGEDKNPIATEILNLTEMFERHFLTMSNRIHRIFLSEIPCNVKTNKTLLLSN
jgi:hypothetical protein